MKRLSMWRAKRCMYNHEVESKDLDYDGFNKDLDI